MVIYNIITFEKIIQIIKLSKDHGEYSLELKLNQFGRFVGDKKHTNRDMEDWYAF